MAQFELALPIVLEHEAGFSNDPDDPGGMTNLGVTIGMWAKYTGRDVSEITEAEMRALTPEKVAPFYKQEYWDKLELDNEPEQEVAASKFDFFVNVKPETFEKVQAQAAVPRAGDAWFRAKAEHYMDETTARRKRMPKVPGNYPHANADEYLLGWLNRSRDMNPEG